MLIVREIIPQGNISLTSWKAEQQYFCVEEYMWAQICADILQPIWICGSNIGLTSFSKNKYVGWISADIPTGLELWTRASAFDSFTGGSAVSLSLCRKISMSAGGNHRSRQGRPPCISPVIIEGIHGTFWDFRLSLLKRLTRQPKRRVDYIPNAVDSFPKNVDFNPCYTPTFFCLTIGGSSGE